jgi:para-nitrobenzyl esterase
MTGISAPEAAGVTACLGIPFAKPPVGALRWKAPQKLEAWSGVRAADKIGPRCTQHAPYGEIEPGNPNMSEDCLYLNVWRPSEAKAEARLPVIYWIHGGEFWAGSGSEPRYNGAKLAARGAVVVTVNHRLGVYGFLSHPELTAESGRGASGNYGLMDLIAGLEWVHDNIAAFGGDTSNITVAGESAGSCAVSAFMAMPATRNRFHRALGESCAYFMFEPHSMAPLTLAENEQRGVEFLKAAGVSSIAELRGVDGPRLLEVWLKDRTKRMQPCIDGFVMPEVTSDTFAAGRQARIPLLAGWNADEGAGYVRAKPDEYDVEGFRQYVRSTYGEDPALLELYPSSSSPEAFRSAVALAGDRNMIYPTWKWVVAHAGAAPTYAYRFDRKLPGVGVAHHACEIEYAFGALDSKFLKWEAADRTIAELMGDYWVNFARSGDPNGAGLPEWPRFTGGPNPMLMRLDAPSHADVVPEQSRMVLLDQIYARRK